VAHGGVGGGYGWRSGGAHKSVSALKAAISGVAMAALAAIGGYGSDSPIASHAGENKRQPPA